MICVVLSCFLERKMSQDRDADDIGFLYKTMSMHYKWVLYSLCGMSVNM